MFAVILVKIGSKQDTEKSQDFWKPLW